MPTSQTFPFGRPVLPCPPSASSPKKLFVLGAYPSALHVHWTPPPSSGLRKIQAIAVDNEPTPFWDGADQQARVDAWLDAVKWDESRLGVVKAAAGLNGPSGSWVVDQLLTPLGLRAKDAWITDCLDTYRCSTGLAKRLEDTYSPFAKRARLPSAELAAHPSETEIVAEALDSHRDRLTAELRAARPELVVTLGNAAMRVFRALVELPEGSALGRKLTADPAQYGKPVEVRLQKRTMLWIPLAHPAAPKVYQEAHARWVKRQKVG